MKITCYYVCTGNGLRIGPYFRRRSAERVASGRAFFGVPGHLAHRFQVLTRSEWQTRQRQPSPAEPDLIAYARAHVTTPAAHALLDEVERGRARTDDCERLANLRWADSSDPLPSRSGLREQRRRQR
jgi:hypothetical protein